MCRVLNRISEHSSGEIAEVELVSRHSQGCGMEGFGPSGGLSQENFEKNALFSSNLTWFQTFLVTLGLARED